MRQTKRKSFAAALLLLGLAGAAFVARQAMAQVPGAPPSGAPLPGAPSSGIPGPDTKTYTNKPIFHLPVKIEDRFRDNLRELVLFAKTAQTDWVRHEALPPTGSHFKFHVPQDGEYWFTVVMVDKAGRMTPPDVAAMPPGLRVVVDSQAPQIETRTWTSPEGEVFLKCLVLDANPDLTSVRVVCRGDGGADKIVEPVPNLPGLIRITPELMHAPVRVVASDLCKNQAALEINVRDLLGAALVGGNPGQNISTTSAKFDQRVPPTLLPDGGAPVRKQEFPQLPPTPPVMGTDPSGSLPRPGVMAQAPGVPNGVPGMHEPGIIPPGNTITPPPAGEELPKIPPVVGSPMGATSPMGAAAPAAVGNRQLLNAPHANIEYRIDQVGPSGVGKVEVFLTPDGGTTWQRAREDMDKRSPADIDLPGEGLFGIRLVVTNGNGFGGTAPQRGEVPTFWIEVDTTSPFVQFRPVDTNVSGGMLDIRWTATDKNLGAEPVTLYYRNRPDGAWQVMARNVKNEGLFRWNFPRDGGSQFFFKIEVADQAGNVARAETPNAVVLDMTEPRAQVLGVTSLSRPGQ